MSDYAADDDLSPEHDMSHFTLPPRPRSIEPLPRPPYHRHTHSAPAESSDPTLKYEVIAALRQDTMSLHQDNAVQYTKLNDEINELKADKSTLSHALSGVESQLDQLRRSHTEATKAAETETAKHEQTISQLENQIKQTLSDKDRSTDEVMQFMEGRIATLLEREKELKLALREAQGRSTKLKSELKDLNALTSQSESESAAPSHSPGWASAQRTRRQAELEELRRRVEAADDKFKLEQSEHQQSKLKNVALQRELDSQTALLSLEGSNGDKIQAIQLVEREAQEELVRAYAEVTELHFELSRLQNFGGDAGSSADVPRAEGVVDPQLVVRVAQSLADELDFDSDSDDRSQSSPRSLVRGLLNDDDDDDDEHGHTAASDRGLEEPAEPRTYEELSTQTEPRAEDTPEASRRIWALLWWLLLVLLIVVYTVRNTWGKYPPLWLRKARFSVETYLDVDRRPMYW